MTQTAAAPAHQRQCGACSLCCTVLRVDELSKLGGQDCAHQRAEGGCAIHARRPDICRAYHCLWLRGHFEESDRPDRLGAVLDFVNHGGQVMLEVREARAGSFDASPRLQQIAERQAVGAGGIPLQRDLLRAGAACRQPLLAGFGHDDFQCQPLSAGTE